MAGTIAGPDEGMQSFLRHVYNTMALGLVISGAVALAAALVPPFSRLVFSFPLILLFIFAPLIFLRLGFTPQRIPRLEPDKVRNAFAAYSGAMGISVPCLLFLLPADSIARMFFIAAAAFAATSLYGARTKREIGNTHAALVMGAAGVAAALAACLLLQTGALDFAILCGGVLVFTGIAAWESHILKESYIAAGTMDGARDRLAMAGALIMYMTFVRIFESALSLPFQAGRRR
jgi:uncharacterized protein